MSIKTAKKLGFFVALSMLIGSVVGIGIFFKNGSILKAGGYNGETALTAWIVGGLFALFAALSFSEIGSMKTGKISGLSAWSTSAGGKKYGYFVKTSFVLFYWGLLVPIVSYFVTELLFLMFNSFNADIKVPPVWVNGLISILISIFSLVVNFVSIKISGWIQQIATVLKFLPLLIALFVGIAFFDQHHVNGRNYFNKGKFSFEGLLAGLPAVLFSYDAFMTVPQLTNKVKGGSKTVSKAVLIGLITIIILYSLIALAAMFHAGSISGIINDAVEPAIASNLNIFVHITLFIAGYGVLNGLSAAMIASTEQGVETNALFGIKALKNRFNIAKTKIIVLASITTFSFMVAVVPGMILGSDAYIDAVSNFPTLFFFVIYATTVLCYTLRRDSFGTKKINKYLFYIAAWTFVLGTYFIVAYQLLYGFTIRGFINGAFAENIQGIGLFAKQEYIITNLDFFIIFMAFLAFFLGAPALNYYLIKKFEKRDPFVSSEEIVEPKAKVKTTNKVMA